MRSAKLTNAAIIKIAAAVIVLFVFAGSGWAQEKLRWTGCGITRTAFMTELATAYLKKEGVMVSLSGGGATKGIRDTNTGTSDMGGSCRPSLSDEFPDLEGKVELYQVAWDALVPIVNRKNPVNTLTTSQVKDILVGKITNWKEVGGNDQKILVVARQGKISGVGYMTQKMIFEEMKVDYTKDALILASSGPLENKISVDEEAFGITGVSSAKKRIESGKDLKILQINGMEASMDNIANGFYPYFRPLYIAVNPDSPMYPKVKKFIDWTLSDEGQKVIESAGTVNLKRGTGLKEKFKYWENTKKIVNFDSIP